VKKPRPRRTISRTVKSRNLATQGDRKAAAQKLTTGETGVQRLNKASLQRRKGKR